MKKRLKISTDTLPEALASRFLAQFEVARTRSIVQWTPVPEPEADVVVANCLPATRRREVVLLIDGAGAVAAADGGDWVRLAPDFRVSTLISALDLAAVRVLNTWDRQVKAVQARPDLGYRLRYWVALGGERATRRHARVMAAMSRRTVTRAWMVGAGGLSAPEADELLADLQVRGALQAMPMPADRELTPLLAEAPEPPHAGFVGRLKRWLSTGRSPTPASRQP